MPNTISKRCQFVFTLAVLCMALIPVTAVQAEVKIFRVDGLNGSTTGDGSGWGADAFLYLQDGLDDAEAWVNLTQGNTAQVWVRGGATVPPYLPDRDRNNPNGTGSRSATFQMHNYVRWYAGFKGDEPGTTEGFLSRAPYTYVTILSGDIGVINDISDNSFHVVTADSTNANISIIDGFTIERGNALGSSPPSTDQCMPANVGGGMLIIERTGISSPTQPEVLRCTFQDCRAEYGGAVFIHVASHRTVTFQACKFIANTAIDQPGGAAAGDGGAVYFHHVYYDVTTQNCAHGAVPVDAWFTSSLFYANTADRHGGAIYSTQAPVIRLFNSSVVQNTAGGRGGGLFHENATPCSAVLPPDFGESNGALFMHSSILWDNTCGQPLANQDHSFVGARYGEHSDIQFWTPEPGLQCGVAVIDTDPLFIDPVGGNFRLTSPVAPTYSPCIDRGLSANIEVDAFDLDQDGCMQDLVPDLDLLRRDVRWLSTSTACFKDMGCYEANPPPCPGDVNNPSCGDGQVNVNDLLAVINNWNPEGPCQIPCNACPSPCIGDADRDCRIDVNDLLVVINAWGPCPGYQGESGGMPQSIQDCIDLASESYPAFSPEWNAFVNKCVQGLCEAHIINCN